MTQYISYMDSLCATLVDSDVLACAAMPDGLYYLARVSGGAQLKGYDPAAMTWKPVLTVKNAHDWSLAATQSQLYMMDAAGQIYTVDLENGALMNYAKVPDASTFDLPKGYTVSDFKIEAVYGQLNVYAALEEASAQPSFSFIEFTSTSDSDLPNVRLVARYAIKGETAAWARLKPAKQYSPLSRGSRGEAVRAIQKPLRALGYYSYYIDGIFGPRTEYAVRLLQSDLNRPVTGVADAELQRLILEGRLSDYDACGCRSCRKSSGTWAIWGTPPTAYSARTPSGRCSCSSPRTAWTSPTAPPGRPSGGCTPAARSAAPASSTCTPATPAAACAS